MPLGARDVLIMVRATDMASSTLVKIGGSFKAMEDGSAAAAKASIMHGAMIAAVGMGMIALGAKGISILKGWADAAVDYNQQAALTLTQTQGLGISLDEIKRIGRDVAKAIPAPFEQMQASLYDIFSSMSVNAAQAQKLLTEFARGAVAGQTDVQTAGRASIAMMNAFKIPVEDVNRVMDVQFQLVAKGVGTYEEFANVLGRAAPSAVRLGQNFETLAGMLAFLTRNGLSTSQAATSAGRALDALSKNTVAERLDKMGISLRDATGNYRPLVDIVRDMNEEFKNLSAPEKAAALEELFKGAGGTIQARRFFDLVFANFDEFEARVNDMQNAAGAMDGAYDIMFEQPQTQMQLFKNKMEVLRTELGDRLLPVFDRLLEVGNKVMDWFGDLSEEQKDLIVKVVAVGSAFLILTGVVLTLVGAFVIMTGVFALAGISMATFAITVAGILVLLAALAAIAYLIYRNWDTLEPIFKMAFDSLKIYAADALAKLQEFVAWVSLWFPHMWDAGLAGAAGFWGWVRDVAIPTAIDWKNTVDDAVNTVIGAFMRFQEVAGAVIQGFLDTLMVMWPTTWEAIKNITALILPSIVAVISGSMDIVRGIIQFFSAALKGDWSGMWQGIHQITSGAMQYMAALVRGGWDVAFGIFRWALATTAAIVSNGFDVVLRIVAAVPSRFWSALANLPGMLANLAVSAANAFTNALISGFSAAINFAASMPGRIVSAFGGIGNTMYAVGLRVGEGLLNGILAMGPRVAGAARSIADKAIGTIKDALGVFSPSRVMHAIGVNTVQGMVNGLREMTPAILDQMDRMAATVAGTDFNATMAVDTAPVDGARPVATTSGPTYVEATFNIYGATDPVAVGREVDKKLNDFYREMQAGPRR